MFSSLLAAPCELKLHLLQNAVFLRPPTAAPNEDTPPTSTDEVARGMVELYVPGDRKIGGIRVKLRAVQSVAILPEQKDMINFSGASPIAWEDSILMEKVVEIGLPKSKSHVTVPGDDVVNSGERRGRSRASRNATPVSSRPSSPSAPPPPDYEEEDRGLPTSNSGFGSAFARAISRGRPSSSRPSSRSASRPASRAASPTRNSGNGSGTSTAQPSPRLEGNARVEEASSSSSPTLTRLPSVTTVHRNSTNLLHPSPGEEYDSLSLSSTLSRTGLSNGRNLASGPHPHAGDREDHYGLIPPSNGLLSRGGRGGAGSAMQGAASSRSATLSPSRGFGRRGRDESKTRRGAIGNIKGVRSPSLDTAVPGPSSNGEDQGGLDLQKGVHGFEFAFILPADSPPYERSPYGRVRYLIKATAIGAGRAKSNLEAWRDLFPVVNPSPEGEPTALTILYNDLHPTVGLLSVACTSNNISVGGIFNVDIHSPTPPTDLIVYLVRVSVETSTELRTKKRGRQFVPAQRHKLFEKGWVPPRPNDPHGPGDGKKSEGFIRDPTKPGSRADDAWTVQGIARMPNDNVVRSSTVPRTKASIRFTHQILVEVVHSREAEAEGKERKLKVFALRQPITLPSCCVAYDSVTLPAYTREDDSSRPAAMPYDVVTHSREADNSHGFLHHTPGANGEPSTSNPTGSLSRLRLTNTATPAYGVGHEFCVCGQSIQDLSERERNLMPAVPHQELPLDGLSHRKIGELPERNEGLRRSTSRSSSTSSNRSGKTGRRSISIGRSLSKVRRSSSSSSSTHGARRPSLPRPVIGGGERGQGVIRTMSRGSRGNELPGEAQAHHINGVNNPPAYGDLVEEEVSDSDGEDAGEEEVDTRGRAPRRPEARHLEEEV